MESSQEFFFFLVDFQKKLKEHPKCSHREEREMDVEELPKNFPSLCPQLLLNHFNFQNQLLP